MVGSEGVGHVGRVGAVSVGCGVGDVGNIGAVSVLKACGVGDVCFVGASSVLEGNFVDVAEGLSVFCIGVDVGL